MSQPPNLLSTKLNRPPVPEDFISRPWLFDTLNQGLTKPITLISAPAGYGKTTTASAWLEGLEFPKSWISLDRNDIQLDAFLAYFLAAIRTMFPTAGKQTGLNIAEAKHLHPFDISSGLINDLDQIPQDFVVVLDNYSAIQEQAIHGLLTELLRHPPHAMHLLLTSRHDPPLPINSLRVSHQMVEIRGQSLRFTRGEIDSFLQKAVGAHLNERSIAILDEKTEGWAAGLRLVALSMIHTKDIEQNLASLENGNRYILEYLASEVLSHLPANLEIFLLKTSILENPNSSLCEAVTGLSDPFEKGQAYLEWLVDANLFTREMDDPGKSFRYHHQFQDILKYLLRQRYRPDEIADLHNRASEWYAMNGYIDDAIMHAQDAGNTKAVVQLIEENRQKAMNQEGWEKLEHWLQMVPREIIDERPDLLLLETWILRNRFYSEEVVKNLNRVESLIDRVSLPPDVTNRLRGEVCALRSQQFYWQGDSRRSLQIARRSLKDAPLNQSTVRGVAWGSAAGALHMMGDLDGAFETLYEGLEESNNHHCTFPASVFVALLLTHWMEADPTALIQTAEHLLKLARERNLPESVMWANYFLGYAHYEKNNLEAAEKHFSSVVRQDYMANAIPYSQSVFGLAATYLAQELPDRAHSVIESAKVLALEMNNTRMLTEIQAFHVRYLHLQGNKFEAERWASRSNHTWRFSPLPTLYPPPITLVQILLDQGTPESLTKATQAIDWLQDTVKLIHNTRYLIVVLALKALLQDACHKEAEAFATLEEAVCLAQSGGVVRAFVDLGKRMASLLSRLPKPDGLSPHIDMILHAYQVQKLPLPDTGKIDMVEPLTNRELEILMLLAQRLSNKEIAQELVISPLTVKRHNINIYQKLNANNRREAVLVANHLGIVHIPNPVP
jgi:LuxR family maltose regulon positive regulatory protein